MDKTIRISTIRLKHKTEGREAVFNVEDAKELCKTNWEIAEPQLELESIDDLIAEESDGDSINDESTPEDKKAIDKLIAEAEAEKIIEPEQSKQPEQPIVEDDIVMPAE